MTVDPRARFHEATPNPRYTQISVFLQLEKQIQAAFRDALSIRFGIDTEIILEQPRQASFGELAVPVAFQLAMGLGVALGAIAWRIGELAVSPGDSATLPFRIAFLLVATVALIGVWDSMLLQATAGEHVAKRRTPDAFDK